tara:strand:- start:611 stop:787 length:177 start_codon:yes stop_codon:yes gene_type:complete
MIDALCSIGLLLLATPFKQGFVQFIILWINPASNKLDGESVNVKEDDANLAFLGYLSE